MQKILVPTDFSDCAENAMLTAANLASASGASLTLIHSVDTPVDWIKLPKNKEADYPETRAKIGRAKDNFEKIKNRKEFKNLKVDTFIAYNIAHEDIIKYCKDLKADLIVMGTHGAGGISELWLGSNTQRIVRNSTVPVLSIKCSAVKKIKNIIFASDFKDDVTNPFKKVLDFADANQSSVELLYINTPAEFKDNHSIEKLLSDFEANFKKRKFKKSFYNAYHPAEGILNYLAEGKADALALTTHGHYELFNVAVAEKVVNRSPVPVLTLSIAGMNKK
jgi:nucleotide-binding universal stress UspA family protein